MTDLPTAMVRMAHLVNHVFAEVSRDHDLTPQQAQLMCQLIAGPVGMGELTRLMRLEKSSMSGLVDRVERRGLVERVRDTCDRRAYRIELTEDGVRLANKSHEGVIAELERRAASLTDEERDALTALLGKVLD
ncbi:MarR family transcriptional regulator [Saccharopolyspora taberi]